MTKLLLPVSPFIAVRELTQVGMPISIGLKYIFDNDRNVRISEKRLIETWDRLREALNKSSLSALLVKSG